MPASRFRTLIVTAACALLAAPAAPLAQSSQPRLPREVFDVIAPSERIEGRRGAFRIVQPGCRVGPLGAHTRRRIVDIAVQEWGVFGFQTLDLVATEERALPTVDGLQIVPDALNPRLDRPRLARRTLRLGRWEDDDPVLSTVAGYWSATPDGAAVIAKQNRIWSSWFGDQGIGWVEPWSAAFVSWVMCEAGLGERETFRRSIAHWEYVDQAIEALDNPGARSASAYVARDYGEAEIHPGDLLCGSRGAADYRSLADRRPHMGVYAPLHCDIVVKVDAGQSAIFVIGGNVLNSVSLSALRAEAMGAGLSPAPEVRIAGARRWFAHLQLQTGPIESDALDRSPTIRALQTP